MLNTPYDRGWRAAANAETLPAHAHAGYVNGYQDAVRNGYAPDAPGRVSVPEAQINGNALDKFMRKLREIWRARK